MKEGSHHRDRARAAPYAPPQSRQPQGQGPRDDRDMQADVTYLYEMSENEDSFITYLVECGQTELTMKYIQRTNFRRVVMENAPGIEENILRIFRLHFVADAIGHAMDPGFRRELDMLIHSMNVDIIKELDTDDEFLQELLACFTDGEDTDKAKDIDKAKELEGRRDQAILLLLHLRRIIETTPLRDDVRLHLDMRFCWFGLLVMLRHSLASSKAKVRQAANEIFRPMVMRSSTMIRSQLVKEAKSSRYDPFIGVLIRCLIELDAGLAGQLNENLRRLLEIPRCLFDCDRNVGSFLALVGYQLCHYGRKCPEQKHLLDQLHQQHLYQQQ
ncbi:Platinum sensitivity protein [Mortierella sp. AD031]|nr:Platinum sensitivity protein [Mortierella sp. AD031]